MSINVNFYSGFSKRMNSTLRPSGQSTTYTCLIKEPCSILNPRIELDANNPTSFNYAYIPSFNRYYYVGDWISDHGLWIATLSVDAMASQRTGIRNSPQFVDRAANIPQDNGIIDGKYACTVNTTMENIAVTGANNTTRPFLNSYKCMISATTQGGNDGIHPQTINGAAYYVMTPGKAESFIRYLLDDPTYLSLNVDEISDSLAKGIINPVEYIGESYILPYDLVDIDVPTSNVAQCKMYVGWWPVDVENNYDCMIWSCAYKKLKIWESNQIVLSNHPQSSTVGKYVNCAPYTEIQLFAGAFGYVTIDPLLLTKYTAMKLVVYGDFKAQAELDILFYDATTQTYVLWKKLFCNVQIPFQLSQLSSDGVKALQGAGAGVGGMASSFLKDDPIGMIGSGVSGILSLAGSQVPKVEGGAAFPSICYMKDDWFVHCEYHYVTDQAPNLKGRPFCESVILSNIQDGGFVQITEPVLDLACTPQEISMIENYMRGGFFLE